MGDRRWVRAGGAVIAAAVLFGVAYAVAGDGNVSPPQLDLPEGDVRCVEPAERMAAEHPVLLDEWRDAVVREGRVEYTSSTGEKHVMSLTGTCLDCHGPQENFCARCHDYAGVHLTCWNCHVEPNGN